MRTIGLPKNVASCTASSMNAATAKRRATFRAHALQPNTKTGRFVPA